MIVRNKVCHQTGIALQKQKPDKEVRERNKENQRNGKCSVSLSDTQTDLPCCSNFLLVNKLLKLTKNADCVKIVTFLFISGPDNAMENDNDRM